VLTAPRAIPTVRLTVRFTPEVASTEFSWVLVDATTIDAGVDGWLTEAIHLWSEAGTLLASSSQLRLAR
jgi:Acyl-CoA thioesterase C-terminal domain